MDFIFLLSGTYCLMQCFSKTATHKWAYWIGLIISLAIFTGLKNSHGG